VWISERSCSYRNRPPDSADEELFEERRSDQIVVAKQDVRRHKSAAEQAGDHHSQAASGESTQPSDGHTAGDGAKLANNSYHSRLCRRESELALEERRVQVLSAVGDAVEAGHEHDHVDEQHPVLPHGGVGELEEGLERAAFLLVVVLGLAGFALRFGD